MINRIPEGPEASATDQARRDAAEVVEKGKEQARSFAGNAKEKGDGAITAAGEELDGLTDAIDAAAEHLSDDDKDSLSRYAHQLSDEIASLGKALQNKSVDELAGDVRALARQNPIGYLLGSIALGFALSRFAKASDDPATEDAVRDARASGPSMNVPGGRYE